MKTFSLFLLLAAGPSREALPEETTPCRILDGSSTVEIPFRMNRGDIVLDVEVNGHALVLGLDNGHIWDQLLFYGSSRIDALDLEYDGEILVQGSGAGDPVPSRMASGITLRFPGLEIPAQSAIITPESSGLTAAFAGEDGIISGSLFNNFVVAIDFDEMLITLTEPEAFEPEGRGEAHELVSIGTGYTLACTVELRGGERFPIAPCIDLGSIYPLDLFVDGRRDIPVPAGALHKVLAMGAQGAYSGHLGSVASLRIGGHELRDLPTCFVGIEHHRGNGDDGLLGLPVLRRFLMTFDYRNRLLYLQPNEQFAEPFACDRSGLELASNPFGGLFIAEVVPGAPGEEAGLAAGDLLLEIDGVPTAELTQTEVEDLLAREAGLVVRLKVQRGAEKLEAVLELRRYF